MSFISKDMRLVIATPFYEVKGYSPYIASLVPTIMTLCKIGIVIDYWELSGDSYIDRARNNICNRFMKSDYTHLMFIDSDMGWKLDSFFNVLKRDVDIVGAGYPCKNNWDFYGIIRHPDNIERDGMIKVSFLPTGFMKIKRTALVDMVDKMPNNWYVENGDGVFNFFGRIPPLGEDGSFCKRFTDCGGELWVEPDCSITHMSVKGYTGNLKETLAQGSRKAMG